jgi:DNA-binding transcriptional LysR family regulator
MDLDLRLVRYFVAVADELHFGRAAEKLYISQPALSKQIRRLEANVGFKLFVRDSRHVELTSHGERFLEDARCLLATADRMLRRKQSNQIRMAHVFELGTSRMVADAYRDAFPGVQVVESSMDSARQLVALLNHQLDVAIMRVTAKMRASHPAGWRHEVLRFEPFWLVGRPTDPPGETASLHGRPLEVFGDGQGSALYNVHSQYLSSFEHHIGVPLRWLGNPGTFQNCLAALTRARDVAYVLEFESYARRYRDHGIPIYRPVEIQPVYPWSIVWRDEPLPSATVEFLNTARETGRKHQWMEPSRVDGAPVWIPPEDLGGGVPDVEQES